MATATRTAVEGNALGQRLAGLRRRLRFVATFRGASWLLTAVLATLVVVGLADWRWHLPSLVRAVALTGLLGAAGLIVYRLLIRPLAQPADDLSLALRVEERYPILNDALASTVQFLNGAAPDGESVPLRREAVRRAMSKAEGCDFARVVDSRGLRTAGLCSLAACVVAACLVVLSPAMARTALGRLANPFGGLDWPRNTLLELGEVKKQIGRGKPYIVRGTLAGVVPNEVTATVSYEGFPAQTKTFSVRTDKDGTHSFAMHLKPDEVQRNFRFSLRAGDATTEEFSVEVLPLPTLVPIDGKSSPQLTLRYPRYTDLPSPHRLTPGVGNIDAIAGTVVTLRARADRPLKRAWIAYQPEAREMPVCVALAPLGSNHLVGVLTGMALGQDVWQSVPARLEKDRRTFHATFRPAPYGMYAIHFEDEAGLENSRTFELRLKPDPAPTVRLDRPSSSKDMLTVLPTAQLPLQLMAEDQQFALRRVWVEYRTIPDEMPRRIDLYDYRRGLAREAGALAGVGVRHARVPRLRLQRLEFDHTLAIRELRHANGEPLKDGDTVYLQACADDFDDVTYNKEPGRSHSVEIRIVSRNALEVALNTEQTRVQQELTKVRDKQREARQKVAEAEARVRKGGKMIPEREAVEAAKKARQKAEEAATEEEKADKAEKAGDEDAKEKHRERAEKLREEAKELEKKATEFKNQAAQLNEAEQLQQQIRERIGDDKEGLRSDVERLRRTLEQNGMRNTRARDDMDRVAKELERLADRELEKVSTKLSDVRKMAELEDEEARKRRKAELEKQATQAEREAAQAEKQAKKLEDAANAFEKQADKGDARDRARRQAEAKRLRQRAEEERQKAVERRAQALRDRQAALKAPDPEKAKSAVAEARRGQEEVEKSLDSLLKELEPHGNSREMKMEAKRLLEDQKNLKRELAKLDTKETKGKNADELTPRQKAELDSLKEQQDRLRERATQLMEKMKKLGKDEKSDPQTAKEMRDAATQAEKDKLTESMKGASDDLKDNKLELAAEKQEKAMQALRKLAKNLDEKREAEMDRLIRKLKDAERKIEDLMDEQELLQRKIREANKIANKEKREQELKKLERKQKELKKRTDDLLKRLERTRNERARQSLGQAAAEMEDAAKQLGRGEGDDEKQEDVLDRMEEARREIERARKKAEEDLGREQLIRVSETLKALRERHRALVADTRRMQEAVQQNKAWTRGLSGTLSRLAVAQKKLGSETAGIAKKELTAAPIFRTLLQRVARSMDQAAARLDAMKAAKPAAEDLPDAELDKHQKEALRRQDQLLDALKDQQDEPQPLSRGQGGEGGEGGEGGDGDGGGMGGAEADGLPPLAQLKLLRAMQKEVNKKTADFRKAHPDLDNLGAKDKKELDEIRREQKEVADLLEKLTEPDGDPDEGDKPEGGMEKAEKKEDKP